LISASKVTEQSRNSAAGNTSGRLYTGSSGFRTDKNYSISGDIVNKKFHRLDGSGEVPAAEERVEAKFDDDDRMVDKNRAELLHNQKSIIEGLNLIDQLQKEGVSLQDLF
jgi:hypothetical protein